MHYYYYLRLSHQLHELKPEWRHNIDDKPQVDLIQHGALSLADFQVEPSEKISKLSQVRLNQQFLVYIC